MNILLNPKASTEILEILIQVKMPSTSFISSRRGELNSPFFNHYLFFYSIYHAPNRPSIKLTCKYDCNTKEKYLLQCHSPRHRRHLPYIFKNIFLSNIHLQIRTKTDKTNNCKTSSLNQVPLHDNMAFEKGKIQDSINSPPPIWANR